MARRRVQPVNLWPEFDFDEGPPSIRSILLEAGSGITERTDKLIRFEVDTRSEGSGGFVHTCYLAAERINFRYPLIKVSHGLDPYPVTVVADSFPRSVSAGSEAELINDLREIFRSDHTRRIVRQIRNALR
jgi:hypothetical protein